MSAGSAAPAAVRAPAPEPAPRSRARTWIPVALAVAVLLAALAVVLSDAETRRAGTNGVPVTTVLGLPPGGELCFPGQAVPAAVGGIRTFLTVAPGTTGRLTARLVEGGRTVAAGSIPVPRANGMTSIPLAPAGGDATVATVCLGSAANANVDVAGDVAAVGATLDGRPVAGIALLDYERAGEESWGALAGVIAERFAVGKPSWVGPWTLWAALGVMALLGVAGVALALRAGRLRPRVVALACAGVACANALVWGVVVPPFHVPDESVHAAYVQFLAEEGRPPIQDPRRRSVSSDQEAAMDATRFERIAGYGDRPPPWEERQLGVIRGDLSRVDGGGASTAANNPPLYHALAVPAYAAAADAPTFLDRLGAMRLVSALLAAVTAAGVFAFLRELLPRHPSAWAAGALAAGLQPVFRFVAGGVNSDNGLFAVSAWLLAALLRALRHGLTARRAAAIGALCGLGMVTKLTFAGLLPAAALGVALAAWRRGRAGLAPAALALGLAVAPFALYLALNAGVWDRVLLGADAASGPATEVSLAGRLSYLWQSWLPRLPFMTDLLPGSLPAWSLWFQPFIGRFGWLEVRFPMWGYQLAAVLCAPLALGALLTLVRRRRRVLGRAREALVCLAAIGGLVSIIAFAAYGYRSSTGFQFEQGRYLLPLLALYAGALGLALLAVPARWRPAAAAVLVVLAFGHDLFAQLVTLARYYA